VLLVQEIKQAYNTSCTHKQITQLLLIDWDLEKGLVHRFQERGYSKPPQQKDLFHINLSNYRHFNITLELVFHLLSANVHESR
jgi:hypothetical protein